MLFKPLKFRDLFPVWQNHLLLAKIKTLNSVIRSASVNPNSHPWTENISTKELPLTTNLKGSHTRSFPAMTNKDGGGERGGNFGLGCRWESNKK